MAIRRSTRLCAIADSPAGTVYYGSNGGQTRAFCSTLEKTGPLGKIAAELFRAQKASTRAKAYRGGINAGDGTRISYRDLAYDRKDKVIAQLAAFLADNACGLTWGWGRDEKNPIAPNVLYVELPQGQVSFHCVQRHGGPDYTGGWDGEEASERRVLEFCNETVATPNTTSPPVSHFAEIHSETLGDPKRHQ